RRSWWPAAVWTTTTATPTPRWWSVSWPPAPTFTVPTRTAPTPPSTTKTACRSTVPPTTAASLPRRPDAAWAARNIPREKESEPHVCHLAAVPAETLRFFHRVLPAQADHQICRHAGHPAPHEGAGPGLYQRHLRRRRFGRRGVVGAGGQLPQKRAGHPAAGPCAVHGQRPAEGRRPAGSPARRRRAGRAGSAGRPHPAAPRKPRLPPCLRPDGLYP